MVQSVKFNSPEKKTHPSVDMIRSIPWDTQQWLHMSRFRDEDPRDELVLMNQKVPLVDISNLFALYQKISRILF